MSKERASEKKGDQPYKTVFTLRDDSMTGRQNLTEIFEALDIEQSKSKEDVKFKYLCSSLARTGRI